MKTEHELLLELGHELLKIREVLQELRESLPTPPSDLFCMKHQWLKGLAVSRACPQCAVDEAYSKGYYRGPKEQCGNNQG